MSKTKHEQVIEYIEALPINTEISVRKLARQLAISEGTVYRAIKEAENDGLVLSIPKVGTVRTESKDRVVLESLSFAEIVSVLEGKILFETNDLNETPKTFYVAFSQNELAEKNLNRNTMVITNGNPAVVETAAKSEYPLILVGEAEVSNEVMDMLSQANCFVMITPYDAFEVISLINKTLFERVTNRELITINDIMKKNPVFLYNNDQVSDWKELSAKTGHIYFPVVNGEKKLVGIVSPMDMATASSATFIDDVMTPNPISVEADELISYLARLLVWERMEIVPVVDSDNILIGVVGRQDIIEALQTTQKQPQIGDTIDNLVLSGFKLQSRDKESEFVLHGEVTKFMLGETGRLSMGNIAILTANAAAIAIRMKMEVLTFAQSYTYQYYKKIEVETELLLSVQIYPAENGSFQAVVYVNDEEGVLYGLATVILNEVEG